MWQWNETIVTLDNLCLLYFRRLLFSRWWCNTSDFSVQHPTFVPAISVHLITEGKSRIFLTEHSVPVPNWTLWFLLRVYMVASENKQTWRKLFASCQSLSGLCQRARGEAHRRTCSRPGRSQCNPPIGRHVWTQLKGFFLFFTTSNISKSEWSTGLGDSHQHQSKVFVEYLEIHWNRRINTIRWMNGWNQRDLCATFRGLGQDSGNNVTKEASNLGFSISLLALFWASFLRRSRSGAGKWKMKRAALNWLAWSLPDFWERKKMEEETKKEASCRDSRERSAAAVWCSLHFQRAKAAFFKYIFELWQTNAVTKLQNAASFWHFKISPCRISKFSNVVWLRSPVKMEKLSN